MDRKRFSFEGLARPAMIIFAAAVLGGFLNYLFQSYMGRTLGPDEYSRARLAALHILHPHHPQHPHRHHRALLRLPAQGRGEGTGEIAWLMRRNLRLCLMVGVVMGLAMLLLSPFLLEFLDIDQPVLAAMLAAGAFLLMLGTPVNSTTQALQRFNRLAVLRGPQPFAQARLRHTAGRHHRLVRGRRCLRRRAHRHACWPSSGSTSV